MWNPIKIAKLTRIMWIRTDSPDNKNLPDPATVARELNGQMLFPSNLFSVMKFRATDRGRDVLWGRKDKAIEYQFNHIIPVITNENVMNAHAPNTVGGHYRNLIKQWSFEELWNKRFQREGEQGQIGWANEVRSNVSRHVFLSHDFQHVLFRYDTTQLGEACIQAVTNVMTGHLGPKYASYVMALKSCSIHKSLEPLRILREAYKLARATKKEFWTINPLEITGKDVEEARREYNIGAPIRFLRFAAQNKELFNFDSIHPEYNDVELNKAMAAEAL